jgi:hypothetical protein
MQDIPKHLRERWDRAEPSVVRPQRVKSCPQGRFELPKAGYHREWDRDLDIIEDPLVAAIIDRRENAEGPSTVHRQP